MLWKSWSYIISQ